MSSNSTTNNECRIIKTTWDKNIDNICKQNDVAVIVKLKTPYMTDVIKNNQVGYLIMNYNCGGSIQIPIPKSTKEIIVDQQPIYTTVVVKKGE